jgi:hypothetical protein
MSSKLRQAVIGQIGWVVKDLDAAMEGFWLTAGIGPWKVYTAGAPPLKCIYHNHPANYKILLATATSGSMQIELIEYISGDTIHRDFLASGKQGIEHVGIFVSDLDAALKPYKEMGIGILQSADGLGVKQDGRYAYLDTKNILGTILELIQSSSQPQSPVRTYPVIALPQKKGN